MERMVRRRLGAEGWRSAVERHAESGLSVQEFCELEGLGAASFYQWRNRLSAPARRRRARQAEATAPGFVDLGTVSATARSARFEVRLDLGDGVLLHLVRG